MSTRTLTLPVKGVYFDQILSGEKTLEYRLDTPFWRKRIQGREYDYVVITRGYPKKTDGTRRMTFPWRGYSKITMTHPHFGPDPVNVFAIEVTP